jgi:hypothetical protein
MNMEHDSEWRRVAASDEARRGRAFSRQNPYNPYNPYNL